MNLENIFTIRIGSEAAKTTSGSFSHESLGGSTSGSGQSFMDLFLAQLAPTSEDRSEKQDPNTLLSSSNPLLEKKPHLNLTRLLAQNEDIAEDAKALGKVTGDELPHILALNQKAFDDIIKPIQSDSKQSLDASAEETKRSVHELKLEDILLIEDQEQEFTNKIKSIIKKIEALSAEGGPQLIVTNLTPEDITTLKRLALKAANAEQDLAAQNATKEIEISEESKDFDDIFAGLISLISDSLKDKNNSEIRGKAVPNDPKMTSTNGESASGTMIDQPDTISLIQEQASLSPSTKFEERMTNRASKGQESSAAKSENASFNATLKAENAEANPQKQDIAQNPQKQSADPLTNAALSAWKTTPFGSSDSAGLADLIPLQGGHAQATALQNHTSLIAQNQNATQPHPSTQVVAANIQFSAKKGQDTQLSMQLDPPDLGRIDVEMKFGKDKTVKALLTVEKPETYAMLQRDAHTLERALQDAGLDVGGDGISMELAQDGYEFSHDGRHDGSGSSGHGKQSSEDETQIPLETTLDWHIDPETGHTHYSILV